MESGHRSDGDRPDELERRVALDISEKQILLREAQVKQRLRYVWLIGSIIVAVVLGGTAFYGIWTTSRTPFSYVGLIAGVGSTAAAAWLILKHRPEIAKQAYELTQLENKHMLAVSAFKRNVQRSLRLYLVASRRDIESYRRSAARNRRVHNIFQGIIIVGSITVTSLTSTGLENPFARWSSVVLSALVSISAGFTGYFKFRERAFCQQQTADAIEKEFNAFDLRVGDYGRKREEEILKIYATRVEALKEEQRKRELQLEHVSH
ncbi:MAG TPA: DUF4231 domain-containing protein [Pseudonocardiaceae bacterium]